MSATRSWLRRILLGIPAVLLLALLLVTLGLLALRAPRVQRAAIERLTRWTESELGFAVEAGGFQIRPIAGTLDVREPRLSTTPTAQPFARAGLLTARWSPSSIFRRPLRLTALTIEDAVVDLGAPLPAARAEEADAPTADTLPLRVERIAVDRGTVIGRPADKLLSGWHLEEIQIDARFDGRRLDFDRLTAAAALQVAGRVAQVGPLSIASAGSADLDGTLELADLQVIGEELTAQLSGRLDPARKAPSAVFAITTDPGFWLLGEPTGSFSMHGDLELGAWQGAVTFAGPRQPATLLAALVSPEQAAALELADSSFDLAGDLRLEPDRSVIGTLRLGLFRDRLRVLDLVARPRAETVADLPLAISGEARLLPDEGGERLLTARLSSPKARAMDSWRIDEGTASFDQPAVARLVKRLAALYPRLLDPASIADLPSLGSLLARGRFQGRLVDPELAAEVDLRPPGGGRVHLTLAGTAGAGPLRLVTTGSGIDLARITPAASGRVDWRGRVSDLRGKANGRLEVELRNLASKGQPIAESLIAEVSGDRQRLDWRLDWKPGGAAAADAAGIASGTLEPVLPVGRATADLVLETGDARMPRVEGTLRLVGGALDARLRAAVAGREPLALDLVVPLAALDALPPLAVLARLPLARRDGPIEAVWRAANGDWSAILPQTPVIPASDPQQQGRRIGALEGGSSGRATIDLECPVCSTASIEITGFAVELDGHRAVAPRALRLTLADTRLRVEPWSLAGEGLELGIEADLGLSRSWEPAGRLAELPAEVQATLNATVDSTWLALLPMEVLEPGLLSIDAQIQGSAGDLRGEAEVAAPGLRVALAAYPGLALADPVARLALADGLLVWEAVRLQVGDSVLSGSGRSRLAAPLGETVGQIEIVTGLPVIDSAVLPFALRAGILEIEGGTISTQTGAGSLRLAAPADGRPEGVASLAWELPANDWAPLLARLGEDWRPENLEAAVRGSLVLPLGRPGLAEGNVVLDAARLVVRGRETRLEPSIEIAVAAGELRIAPFELQSADATFSFRARADLDPAWQLSSSPASLLVDFELLGDGAIDAGLLSPFLAGGRTTGPLDLDISLRGSPARYDGRIRAAGPEAALLFRNPYLTRIERPSLLITITDGAITLEEGSALLNEGAMELSGLVWREGRSDLQLRVSEALFRLDYGLMAALDAQLRWQLAADGSSTLTGTIDLDRGSLTRPVRLDLNLLSELLAPIDLTTTEEDPLERVALDLALRTREGVRVKNNLGDLLVRWEPLAVTGSLARPVLEGRLEADPGGLLRLYGQTVRLDTAAIEYPGLEGTEPRLDLEVTTSIDDPTIGRLAGSDPFRDPSPAETKVTPGGQAAAADLGLYLGDQFAGKVGESAGLKVSLRPLLIFGETDPGAQLTVGRDLSPILSIAAAVNLRTAEGRTYLLELHDLRMLPRFVAQAYTNDASEYGGALLQRQEFGATGKAAGEELPRISKIVIQPPPGISRRGVRRALGLEKGGFFDPTQRFAAEVELLDYLLFKGYPDARVSVSQTPAGDGGRQVEIGVAITPGPRVQFAFAGEKIPKRLQPLITGLYRTDVFEAESLAEIENETVRALRSRGFLDPTVEVRVEPLDPHHQDSTRRVLIRTAGGVQLAPESPIFLGLPPEDATELSALFVNSVQRIELAVGLPAADRRLLEALTGLGFPEASIVRRYESPAERALKVEIEPGPRQRIASVAIDSEDGAGLSSEELEPLLSVAAGDPLRRNRLSRSALAIERQLTAAGRLEASVRTLVEPAATDVPNTFAVRFKVEPGPLARLSGIEFRGLGASRERWARAVTGLEPGQALARDDLAKARTKLWRTGVFSGVATEVSDIEPGLKRVVFDLAERDRYQLSYGVRWDSQTGPGAVVDATNRNYLGRGWTLGLRALYSGEESSLRGLTRIPRAFGGPGSFELFAAAREITEPALAVDPRPAEIDTRIFEGTLQYSHPLSKRTTVRAYARYTDTLRMLQSIRERASTPEVGLQYVYDSREPEPLTERGVLASVDLSGSQQFFGGDSRYVRMFSQLNLHRPAGKLMGSGLFWAQSYRLGLAGGFEEELARSARFFAGGGYSVRGYATASLGDQAAFGPLLEATGGAALLVLNQELRLRLSADYSLVAFADAGNVWQTSADFGRELRRSVGIGLRAVTPIGLLRLDLAHALDRRPQIDPEFKLYFGVGPAF